MSNEEPRFEKKGLKYNGFRIPWAFVGMFLVLVGNAAVVQYKVQGLDAWQSDVLSRLDQIAMQQTSTAQEQAVIVNRVENLGDMLNWHRTQEHRGGIQDWRDNRGL